MYLVSQHHSALLQQVTSESHISPLMWVLQKHLPLLRLLNNESRWQLWLSHRPMLNKKTLATAGLTASKIRALAYADSTSLFSITEKALISRNFSYIAVCTSEFSRSELTQLRQLANRCGTHLFIVSENYIHHIEKQSARLQQVYH